MVGWRGGGCCLRGRIVGLETSSVEQVLFAVSQSWEGWLGGLGFLGGEVMVMNAMRGLNTHTHTYVLARYVGMDEKGLSDSNGAV